MPNPRRSDADPDRAVRRRGPARTKAMLERYHLAEGDRVHLVETEEGILITPFDPEFSEAMEVYAEGARRYRNAMRELAR